MRGTRRKKFYKKQGETAAKPEAANGIRKKERNFYTDKEELFYVSATGNLRFRNAKRTVRTAETYSSKEETIQTTITFNKKTL